VASRREPGGDPSSFAPRGATAGQAGQNPLRALALLLVGHESRLRGQPEATMRAWRNAISKTNCFLRGNRASVLEYRNRVQLGQVLGGREPWLRRPAADPPPVAKTSGGTPELRAAGPRLRRAGLMGRVVIPVTPSGC
jgi:hypothetical protein